MMDRFSKTCLCLIVLLLTVIVLRPYFAPQPVHAAAQHKYMVTDVHDSHIPPTDSDTKFFEKEINSAAADGWELVATVPFTAIV